MPNDSAVTPTNEAAQYIDLMFAAHAELDHETCYNASMQILQHYSFDHFDEYNDAEALGMIFAKAYEKSVKAGLLGMQRQFTDAATEFQYMSEIINAVHWQENLGENPVFREFRKLDLIARVQKPIMGATEALVRGSFAEASLKILMTETYLPEMRAILDKSAPDTEHYMRETAFTLVSGYFMVGAITHVQNATLGNKLLQAKMFFDRIDMMLDSFDAVDFEDANLSGIIPVMHAFAEAARLRVLAEIAASEEDYNGAIAHLTNSMIAFERIAPMIPADMPTGDVMRESVVNTAAVISQSIRQYSVLQTMNYRLEMAQKTRADLQDQLKELDQKRDEIIQAFARQHTNIEIHNVNDLAAEININNEANMAMQNSGMDQVIQLLGQMPQDENTQKLKKDAEKAKEEKDLAEKIKKVTAVIEGASKLADAASKLVPYGPAVMGALKGVFSLLPLLKRNDEVEAESTFPQTRMT